MSLRHHAQRRALRELLAGKTCHSPASVYDGLSARLAERAGFRIGLLSGSVVAACTLAAPDLHLHTISEFADQIRRVMRSSKLSLLVDADHGYGNALHVMRTVHEFEHAGVSGLAIEDTAAPHAFGQPETEHRLVSTEEMVGKLRAALEARQDDQTVIAARTTSLKHEGFERAVARAKAYAATGVDALWTVTLGNLDELQALSAASRLPVIVGTEHAGLAREALAAHGARIMLQGHLPIAAAVKALGAVYAHLAAGGEPAALAARVASREEMDALLDADAYSLRITRYLS